MKKKWSKTHRRAYVQDEGGMCAKEHIVQPRHRGQVLQVVREPRQDPRHAVIRLHLMMLSGGLHHEETERNEG